MTFKSIILGAALAAFSFGASAVTPYRTVIQIQVICVAGGPASMFEILLEKFNERMVAGMSLTVRGQNIHMYISENKNNPSASVFLHSEGAGQTCLFWGAKDFLHIIEAESLPAKRPSEDTDAQPMPMSADMTTYRQALRDVPASVENSEDVVWPEKPA